MINNFIESIKNINGVFAVYVFGSYTNGKLHGFSDIDICVIGNISKEDRENILLSEFSDVLDISFLEDLPIWIKARVFGEGKCLVVLDELGLNRVKSLVVGEYLDFGYVVNEMVRRTLNV